jgi:hypothetical protein
LPWRTQFRMIPIWILPSAAFSHVPSEIFLRQLRLEVSRSSSWQVFSLWLLAKEVPRTSFDRRWENHADPSGISAVRSIASA